MRQVKWWVLLVVALSVVGIAYADAKKPETRWSLWVGVFKPFSEHLNGDWTIGVDWKLTESAYLGLRHFRSKDDSSPRMGKGTVLFVGKTFPFDQESSQGEGVIYCFGLGLGIGRLEATGKGSTSRAMAEGFVEAQVRSFGVRLGSVWGGLDGNSGWFIALTWRF
jgi:hypothetical protein